MIAALICVVSIAAFLQFFVLYCRAILASTASVVLSDRVLGLMGMAGEAVRGDDFGRLLQLVRLCPEHHDDHTEVRAVGAYYGLLRFLKSIGEPIVPHFAMWAEGELRKCSHFAAVALDRRIANSLNLYGQQITQGM